VINSLVPDDPGSSFGQRRFLDLVPFAVVGFSALAARLRAVRGAVIVAALCLWNIVLEANFEYVWNAQHGTYMSLLIGQLAAIPYLPRLLAKGAAARDLVLWPALHNRFDPVHGLAILLLEGAIVAAVVSVGRLLQLVPSPRTKPESPSAG